MIWPLFSGKAEIQKYFHSFFGSNENFKICFRDLLTFSRYKEVWNCAIILGDLVPLSTKKNKSKNQEYLKIGIDFVHPYFWFHYEWNIIIII